MGVELDYDSNTQIPSTNLNELLLSKLDLSNKEIHILIVVALFYLLVLIYLVKFRGNAIEIILWTLFIIVILGNLWYFKKTPKDYNTTFIPKLNKKNMDNNTNSKFKEKSDLDVIVSPPKSPPDIEKNSMFSKLEIKTNKKVDTNKLLGKFKKEVYHIPNNKYTYLDGKAICKAYGGRLADYDEMESAYDKGANWCSYGWSENQMALFPTQKKVWDSLQKVKGHEHDCGRPGINGGFIKNPNVKFGVNCFGPKPDKRLQDDLYMQAIGTEPRVTEDAKVNELEKHWKSQIDNVLVAPFNKDNWSSI